MNTPQKHDQRVCLLCGQADKPTVEHIVPQALWKRFGIDPDRDDLAVFRTTLCHDHNQATSALHRRPLMLDLIETGDAVTRRTLSDLSDWAVWVTLLLGLSRGSGVLGEDSRALLLRRFDPGGGGGLPRGMRVYAARVSEHGQPADPPPTPHALALRGDSRVLLDSSGIPTGLSIREGPVQASESIGVGRIALLVLGQTFGSGPDHAERLDQAVAHVGLERIHPPGPELPSLDPREISIRDVAGLFTVIPLGAEPSLLPEQIQSAYVTVHDVDLEKKPLGRERGRGEEILAKEPSREPNTDWEGHRDA